MVIRKFIFCFCMFLTSFWIPVISSVAQDVIDSHEYQEIAQLGHGTATSIAWHPSESVIAVGGSLGVWFYDSDFAQVGYIETISEIISLAWSPDGERLATGSKDGKLTIWSTSVNQNVFLVELLRSIDSFSESITAVEWSSSGSFVAGATSHEVIVLNLNNDEQRIFFSENEQVSDLLAGVISWHPSDNLLAIATQNGVLLWDVATDQRTSILPSSMLVRWLSPNMLLTASDGAFQIREPETGIVIRTIAPKFRIERLISFSVHEQYLATTFSSHDAVYLTDITTGDNLPSLAGTDFYLFSLDWHSTGKHIAAITSENNDILVWDLDSQNLETEYRGHNSGYKTLLPSPDGNQLAVHTGDEVEIWDIATETVVATLHGVRGHAAWSPDGSRIATSDFNSSLLIWSASTGDLLSTLEGRELGIMTSEQTLCLEWHKPGIVTTTGGAILLWNIESDKLPEVADCHPFADVRSWWNPAGTHIAVLGWDSTQVWICNNQMERVLSFEGYTTVAWSPDGSEIATVGIGNTLRVWDTSTSEAVATAAGEDFDIIRSITWSPGGSQIVTGHVHGEVRVWKRESLTYFAPVSKFYVDGLNDVTWIGDTIVTASRKGIIQFWG